MSRNMVEVPGKRRKKSEEVNTLDCVHKELRENEEVAKL